jgi:hypothetical protein
VIVLEGVSSIVERQGVGAEAEATGAGHAGSETGWQRL